MVTTFRLILGFIFLFVLVVSGFVLLDAGRADEHGGALWSLTTAFFGFLWVLVHPKKFY